MDNHSYLKVAQEETCAKQAYGKNDIGILGFSKTRTYFLSLTDVYFLLSYNAGHRAGWGLPATSLCMSTDDAFFVIRWKLCNSLFPRHFLRVNCLSAVFPQYAPSHISFITLIHCTVIVIFALSVYSTRLLVPWGRKFSLCEFSWWMRYVRSCLVS